MMMILQRTMIIIVIRLARTNVGGSSSTPSSASKDEIDRLWCAKKRLAYSVFATKAASPLLPQGGLWITFITRRIIMIMQPSL